MQKTKFQAAGLLITLLGIIVFLTTACGHGPTFPISTTPTPTPTQTTPSPSPTAGSSGAIVSTFAQSGVIGGVVQSFWEPFGVSVDSSGNVYVGDYEDVVFKITAVGLVSPLAGSGVQGSSNGTGATASFYWPLGVAVDTNGNVYVGDTYNELIRKISPSGTVNTLAGQAVISGSTNGIGTAATFNNPTFIAVDNSGNSYVADSANNMIRKITPGGMVTTLAGGGGAGYHGSGSSNGIGTAASFNNPYGVAVDTSGNVYVGDTFNNMIRKITPGGIVTTLAGQAGVTGSTNGIGTAASFYKPFGVAVDNSGNVYVSDYGNNLIRKITSGGVVTTLAGTGVQGATNGLANVASFNGPCGIAVDSSGNVYVADHANLMIRKITP